MKPAYLMRKESFGGTFSNPVSGKRVYVNHAEFDQIKLAGGLPDALQAELKSAAGSIIVREPDFLPGYTFSSPDVIFFEITRACNLTCTHCFNNSGKRLLGELSNIQRAAIIEDLCIAGVQEIRFTGGEPLAVRAVFDFISQIREVGLRASIGTNGALINGNVAKRLASAGLNAAITSIDGMEEKHDSIRGNGSFQKTLIGIDALLSEGIPVRVNTVVMKSNLEEVVRVTDYFFKREIPIMIRRLIPAGRADGMMAEMLTQGDYADLRRRLEDQLEDPRGLVRGHYLKDDKVAPRIQLPFTRHACSAGHRGLVILPGGAVQTCGFLGPLGERSPGNLKDVNLASLWKSLVESQHISNLRSLLRGHNAETTGPQTNCLAIALASQKGRFSLDIDIRKDGIMP